MSDYITEEMSEIKQLELYFPHGITREQGYDIAHLAQEIAKARVSEGGMRMLSNPFFGEELKFSEDVMQFIYGYKERQMDEKQ